MTYRFFCVAWLAVILSGCAYVKTDVRAVDTSVSLSGERTYFLTQAPSQELDPGDQRSEATLREELRKYGFVPKAADEAHYLLLPSFETRSTSIRILMDDCEAESANCESDAPPPAFHWFGRTQYRHSLTLRFFDRVSGRQAYKVTAVNLDANVDPSHATKYLVRSALARFAHGGTENWQVKMHAADTGEMPGIVSITPPER